ncbi:MAG: hypothetical protein MR902_01450 [Campylobacter sp.]|nr:hypothetical protein [Campylobacter sp.]
MLIKRAFTVFLVIKRMKKIIKADNDIFFNKINIDKEYEYVANPDRVLSELDNEWFFVKFEEIKFIDEILKLFDIFNDTGAYPNLTQNDFSNLRYFFYNINDNSIINIQNVKSGNLIKTKSLLVAGNTIEL